MMGNEFLGQYQMMEQYGVASAEEVKSKTLPTASESRSELQERCARRHPMIRAWSPYKLLSTKYLSAFM
jgi:hypothetical protein